MLGTKSNEGIRNLAPYTSVSIVANSPPLAVVSLSVDRDNRIRDSLANLRENGKAVLNFLQPNQENARLVEQTCKPIPREESEWEAFSIESLDSNPLIMKNASMAIEAEVVAEHDLPDAKASLVVLRLGDLIVPGENLPTDSVHLLCQHGLNRLMATPTAWDYNIESNV
jgi:flavin reductase (DIM6/NTAB) family NADH-FMN oxidoreductase RutF